MRDISVSEITKTVKELCINANRYMNPDLYDALNAAKAREESEMGIEVLSQLIKNSEIARERNMPICQDTGLAVVFVRLGQEVHITGGNLNAAINEGVRQGYVEGYLRKSVVTPITRINTKDNTPGIIHVEIVDGDELRIDIAPKGAGSENMSRLFMLKPSDGIEGIKASVIKTVDEAGPNACPPLVVGVGIGGNFELCAFMAKKALLRPIGVPSDDNGVAQIEAELLERLNRLGVGPMGLGGRNTVLAVNIETHPTHIASLPMAVNLNCHVTRHGSISL